MSGDENKDNQYRPSDNLDQDLQREIDEALGGMSLEQLIASEEKKAAPAAAARGVRTGTVLSIQGEDIFVDLGGRAEGILAASQFEDQPLPDVGSTIQVTIEGSDKDGLLVLSRQGAVMQAAWSTLEEGQIIEGRVTGHNKGGLELTVNGIQAFMPISQIELFRVEDISGYVNQRFRCQVTEVNAEERRVIVSRRALLELESAAQREQMWTTLAEGQKFPGIVKTIMPYGAFVDIGNGVDGLLHVKDMSHSRVEDPKSVVKEGQKIEVLVLKVDKEARRVSLGLKQILPNPWKEADVKWPANTMAAGRVTRLAEFGAFVELEPGVEGLIPIGELTFARRVTHPKDVVNPGDVVHVRVLSVDMERKRISLSLKRAGDDPWMGASARWPVGATVSGVVSRTADFGAFVELAAGVDGLVHISELSATRVRSVAEAVKVGQTVQAKVVAVDETARRISLSIKQLTSSPDYTGDAAAEPAEPPKPQPKRKKPLKGGLE